MPTSELKLIQRFSEFCEQSDINGIPPNTRGIYALLNRRKTHIGKERFDVVYVGMARGGKSGIKSRLDAHKRKTGDEWTHFSVFEVWPNITQAEVEELEGLFRHIYRKDTKANRLNVQRGFHKLKKIKRPLPWQHGSNSPLFESSLFRTSILSKDRFMQAAKWNKTNNRGIAKNFIRKYGRNQHRRLRKNTASPTY